MTRCAGRRWPQRSWPRRSQQDGPLLLIFVFCLLFLRERSNEAKKRKEEAAMTTDADKEARGEETNRLGLF